MRAAAQAIAACVAAVAMASMPAAHSAVGDAKAGEAIYSRCAACHALAYDRTGPRHCGLPGRRAGSVAGFDYSNAMKTSGIAWNDASLDRFLADQLQISVAHALHALKVG